MTRRREKFIYNYETKIKEIRKEYYKNITNYSKDTKDNYAIELTLKFLPTIFAIVIVITNNFNILGLVTALILDIVLSIIAALYIKKTKLTENNKYLSEIRKLGYFTIEDYESKLKEYVTGENGEYNVIYNKLIKKYNINDKTEIIEDPNGNRYYLWTDEDKTKLYILDTKYNTKPQVETFRIQDIRYFRLDKKRRITVLKTYTEEKNYNKKAYDVLSKYIKNKQFENLKSYKPEENITDFERYMHQVKKEITKDIDYDLDKKNIYIANIITIAIISCGLSILKNFNFLNNIVPLIDAVILIEIAFYNLNLIKFLQYKPLERKNEKEYINYINNNEECISRFNELKIALKIPNDAEKIYDTKGNEYLVWISNGYFHIFLNVITFDSVYIAVKVKDVTYYNLSKKINILELKNNKIELELNSEKVLQKIMPSNDLSWIQK